ncbi:acyl carrier protein [Undibacterium sp. Di27W]|uniref:acyl carrier protein n=1 Tax=Undibacterium sp. Di27W TaxID=3413036 RepID=UPI003BF2D7D8
MTAKLAAKNWNTEQIEDWLIRRVAQLMEQPENDIDPDMPFNSLGLDSVNVMDLIVELDDLLGIEIESTIVWDYPTIHLLSAYIATLIPH